MADIEERIRGYNNAFEGLLSLGPGTGDPQLKRKQTKEDNKKVKKAKLDLESTGNTAVKAGAEMKSLGGQLQREDVREKVRVVAQKQRQKKRKEKGKKAEKKGSEEEGKGVQKGEMELRTTPIEAKAQPQLAALQTNSGNRIESQDESPHKDSVPVEESESDGDIRMDSGESTPVSQSTTITAPEITEPMPMPTPKAEIDPAIRAERRALLAARIEELRAKRMAADGSSAKNRQELIEARRKKEEARRERKRQLRLAAKAAEEETKRKEVQNGGGAGAELKSAPVKSTQAQMGNNFSFGAVTFDDGQQLDHSLQDFKKSGKRKGPTDILGQLKHVEAKKARIQNMDTEKAEKIQEKELWSKALKQAQGEKVRDEEKLLKKSLKRQEQVKRKSEREWKERTDSVAKSKAIKQKKREENLAARREQKKLGKAGKKAKSNGKKKVQIKKKKKGARPGFEGSMKSSRSGGASVGAKKVKK